jgi:hypothetical protein
MFSASGVSTPVSQQPSILAGLRVQTSVYGQAIPLGWGTNRLAGKLIWYGDFKAIPHNETTRVGGKGGGGKKTQTTTTYTYQAAVVILLCAGKIDGVQSIWDTKGRRTTTTTQQTSVIPGTPFRITPTGNIVSDVGVHQSQAYDVIYDDYGSDSYGTHPHLTGNHNVPFVKVTGTPTTGQYAFSAGVYTFAAADAGKTVTMTYTTVGAGLSSPMGQYGFSFFNGDRPQTAWGYLTTNHPTEALAYSGWAYAAASAMDLGDQGELGNLNFEVRMRKVFGGAIQDANPSDIVTDALTDQVIGIGFPSGNVDALAAYSNYCVANGLFLSPVLSTQMAASEFLQTLSEITNTALVWSEGKVKMKPYGDTSAVGNGATYLPDTAPKYDLDKDDFIADDGQPGIRKHLKSVADAWNSIRIEFLDRANDYNIDTVEEKDQGHIEMYGHNPKPDVVQCHWITDRNVAALVANHLLKRNIYIDATYDFRLGVQYAMLECADLVTINDPDLGYSLKPVRIIAIQENDDRTYDITAEEFPWGTATATLYPKQVSSGFVTDQNIDPPNPASVLVYEPPRRASSDGLGGEIWVGCCPNGTEWGGCNVWVSDDGTNYRLVSRITAKMRVGSVSSGISQVGDPDSTSTLGVNMTAGTVTSILNPATQTDCDSWRTLMLLATGELIAYRDCTLVSGATYNLGYLRRGVFGTPILAHSATETIYRIDDAIVPIKYNQEDIGKTWNIKLTHFNRFGNREQSLASVSPTAIVLSGSAKNVVDDVPDAYTHDAIILTGDCTSTASSWMFERFAASIGYTVVSGDRLEYDVWDDPANSKCQSGVEIYWNADANNGRAIALRDQNGLYNCGESTANMTGYSSGRWYHRVVDLSRITGQVVSSFVAFVYLASAGTVSSYRAKMANVKITNANGTVKKIVWQGGLTPVNTVDTITNFTNVKLFVQAIGAGTVNIDDHVNDTNTVNRRTRAMIVNETTIRRPADAMNYLRNPSMEDVNDFWIQSGGDPANGVKTNAANAHSGNKYMELKQSTIGVECDCFQADGYNNIMYFEVHQGDILWIEAWAKVVSGTGNGGFYCQLFDKDLGSVLESFGTAQTPGGSYTHITGTYTVANAGSRFARLYFYCGGGSSITTMWFDDAILRIVRNPAIGGMVAKLGSLAPNWSGSLSYSATTTSITWSWTSLILYRSDGTSVSISNGSQAITGLSASTTYYFYPYYDEVLGSIQWVADGSGVGSPAYAYTATTNPRAQAQGNESHVPLSAGAVTAATPSSGTGGGTGGGSDRVCPRVGTMVETVPGFALAALKRDLRELVRKRAWLTIIERWHSALIWNEQPLESMEIGELLRARSGGWTRLTHKKVLPCDQFVRVALHGSAMVEVSPTHPFTLWDESVTRAENMSLCSVLHTRDGLGLPAQITNVQDPEGYKVTVTCFPESEFYGGMKTRGDRRASQVVLHNTLVQS